MGQYSFDVDASNFQQIVMEGSKQVPVVVDFWAEWCGPCKAFAPVLDDAAKTYQGRVTMAKLDVDACPDTAGRYGVRGIPTVILYKDGKPHAQKVGMMSKSQLAQFLDSRRCGALARTLSVRSSRCASG